MRILIYTDAFEPVIGGAQTYARLLAEGLVERRARGEAFDVTLVTQTPADGWDDSTWPFTVVRRPGIARLWKLIGDSDVVSLAGPCFQPMLIGLLRRKPVVVEHHGYQASCPNGMLFFEPTKTVCPGHYLAGRYLECLRCNTATVGSWRSLRMLLLTPPRRWLSRRVALNVPISAHVSRRLDLPRSEVIYYGVVNSSSPDSAVPFTPPLQFAYVGRFTSEKGVALLLEAAAIVCRLRTDFHVLLIGDGDERARLEAQTDSLGLRNVVSFAGILRGRELDSELGHVAAVVMPSICEETAGLSAIEQMMRGRLVIAAEIGGLAEVVGDAGLKFKPGDAAGLADCISRVLNRPGLVDDFGSRARRRAHELFTRDRMVSEHEAAYRQLLGEQGQANEASR